MNSDKNQSDLEIGLKGLASEVQSGSNLLGLALRQFILHKRGIDLEAVRFGGAKPTVWSHPEMFAQIDDIEESEVGSEVGENVIVKEPTANSRFKVKNIGDMAFESIAALLRDLTATIGPAFTPKMLSATSKEHVAVSRMNLLHGVTLSFDDGFDTLFFSCASSSPGLDDEDRFSGLRYVIELKGIGYCITKKFTRSGVIEMKLKTLFEKGFLSRRLSVKSQEEAFDSGSVFGDALRGKEDSTELKFYPPMSQEQVEEILSQAIRWESSEQLKAFFDELDRGE